MRPYRIRIEYAAAREGGITIVESARPMFSWAVAREEGEAFASRRLLVSQNGKLLWDTGFQPDAAQEKRYAGEPLTPGEACTLRVELKNAAGRVQADERRLCYGDVGPWPAKWLSDPAQEDGRAVAYFKDFELSSVPQSACLFACALGYHKLYINGQPVLDLPLNPAFSQYDKRAYYSVLPDLSKYLRPGCNRIGVRLARGWRNPGAICYRSMSAPPTYTGPAAFSAALRLSDGSQRARWVLSDEGWRAFDDPVTSADLFQGETFDAQKSRPGWALPGVPLPDARVPALLPCPSAKLSPQTLEPVSPQQLYPARSLQQVAPGVWSADFGQNIAGVCRLRLPKDLPAGTKIVLHHAENLDEDGRLFLPQLRKAASVDTYIADGETRHEAFWQPEFTYHGFRYAEISGWPGAPLKEDICAVSLHTDCEKATSFSCGEPRVNEFARAARMTEKANIHSILTDCPQRDERMGWLNDATVRFEAVPYLFDVGRLFPKVVRDIMDVQDDEGRITCTAPFAFGFRPADPVCSSFLIAGWQAYLHSGNLEILREAYPAFRAWNGFLSRAYPDGIVAYSHYGDWAGPAYACESMEGARSSVTPGEVMSTGYHYYNAVLLGKMAGVLGDEEDTKFQQAEAQRIRAAFLQRWYDPASGRVATGSQGCQAFALWLDILPPEGREKAARLLRDDLVARAYSFTTGNLCTRYLPEQLARYGYVNEAWTLLCRQEYPSFGYMLQNEATTIWERFELKKNCGMNSHNHPMHASSYRFLYAYLCGLKPTDAAWRRFQVHPYIPDALLSASASVETPLGDVTLRWVKRYGELHLYLSVPFGATAETLLPWGEEHVLSEGFHHFSHPL